MNLPEKLGGRAECDARFRMWLLPVVAAGEHDYRTKWLGQWLDHKAKHSVPLRNQTEIEYAAKRPF